mmetsp:Transcript_8548/g.16766  ORF Transcript_8548/g.16766 Transcript_8548/m.16766 type:complete len:215 (+) Transcript_8548:191-835(+)
MGAKVSQEEIQSDLYYFFAANPGLQQSLDMTFNSLARGAESVPYSYLEPVLLQTIGSDPEFGLFRGLDGRPLYTASAVSGRCAKYGVDPRGDSPLSLQDFHCLVMLWKQTLEESKQTRAMSAAQKQYGMSLEQKFSQDHAARAQAENAQTHQRLVYNQNLEHNFAYEHVARAQEENAETQRQLAYKRQFGEWADQGLIARPRAYRQPKRCCGVC